MNTIPLTLIRMEEKNEEKGKRINLEIQQLRKKKILIERTLQKLIELH